MGLKPRFDLADGLVILGLALLAGGVAAFDWRLALIVCGAVLLWVGGRYALPRGGG